MGYEGLADGYAVNIISWEGASPLEGPSVSVALEPASSPEAEGRAEEISPSKAGTLRPGSRPEEDLPGAVAQAPENCLLKWLIG